MDSLCQLWYYQIPMPGRRNVKNSLPYEKYTLSNGLRLIFVPMEGLTSVATAVMVAVGSRYETRATNGVSHFLEHMAFKGTLKYPTSDDVNIIERIGGLQNAYTDVDITNYHNKTLSTDWELALEINKELALKPRIEEKFIDRERDVIVEEMKRYEDDPASKVHEAFHTMLYPSDSLGMRTIGEEKSLLALTESALRSYHTKWYRPERMVVILAGDVRGQMSEIRQQTEEWFGNFTLHAPRSTLGDGKDDGGLERVIDKQEKPQLKVITKPDIQGAHLILGLRTFGRASEDRFDWSVVNMVIGVGFTSRLFRQIREKRGLCYHIRSGSDNWHDVGYWSVYAGVATEKVTQATQAILAELAKAVEKGVTEEEVAVAKKRIKTILAFKSEDPEFFTEFYGRPELYGMPILTIEDYIKKIESVTKEGINQLLKRYVVTNTLNMALVWNRKREEKLGNLLHL